ncbi:MAG: hypothetical protein HFE77_00880 [Clostridiales bacterium]|nr:hypothetical protein [Clostridiales bacterium]
MANKIKKAPSAHQPSKKKNRRLYIGLGLLLALILIGTIITIWLLQRQNETGPKANTGSRPDTTIISIIYPDLEDNGQIVYTNTLIATTQTNLYDVLQQEAADKIHFTYDESGALLTAGRLQPQTGEKLLIRQNTSREQIELGAIPSAVSIEDGATYEIWLSDAQGNQLYQITNAD